MAKKPNIDKECCTGCGICIENCPTNSLELVDDIAVLVRPETCDGDGTCAEVCPLRVHSYGREVKTNLQLKFVKALEEKY